MPGASPALRLKGMEEPGASAEAASDIEKANGLLPKLGGLTRVLEPRIVF